MNLEPSLSDHFHGMQLLKDKAKELIEMLSSVPLAQMTRNDLRMIESMEQRALAKFDYYNYKEEKRIIRENDIKKLEELKSHLLLPIPA